MSSPSRTVAVWLTTAVILIGCAPPSTPDAIAPTDLSELREERAELLSRNEELAGQALSTQRQVEAAEADLATLGDLLDERRGEVEELDAEIEDLNDERRALDAERRRLEREVRDARTTLEEEEDAEVTLQPVAAPAPQPASTTAHRGNCVINPDRGDIVCETNTGDYVCRGSASPACGTRSRMETRGTCDYYWNGGRVCGPNRGSHDPPSHTGVSPQDATTSHSPAQQPSGSPSSSAGVSRNCSEERAHGHSNMSRSHPHYRSQFDGDGDGIACET